MPQTPVQRFSHDSSDDVADTAAGHGNWELGTGNGNGHEIGEEANVNEPTENTKVAR